MFYLCAITDFYVRIQITGMIKTTFTLSVLKYVLLLWLDLKPKRTLFSLKKAVMFEGGRPTNW